MSGSGTEEIRHAFLRHFTERGHALVPSASLLADDPTVLLVNAGMVPFKPYFLGQQPAPWPRATSVQKCVRTVDIEMVGVTARHGSFFQMCGNFSFGDYFKERAIPLAWEFVTSSDGLGLPPDRLWVTVYHDDDEAARIWRDDVGVPPARIQRRGRVDNFWSMGVPGPCGPCSEIFWDRGPETGRDGGPEADEDRYLEIWNLVFMQYERGEGTGKEDFPIIGDLPARNIDTGLGLERVATVLQGVESLYDIDINRPVLDRAAALAGRRYQADPAEDVRLRIVADHTRTAVMLIADGVLPGNEGRGYVLRRMLRRAVRNLRLLGVEEPAMAELVPVVRDSLGPSYPELVSDYPRILGYAQAEEESFLATLRAGTTVLDTAISHSRGRGETALGGDVAFRLHDTHGFPIDLTLEIAAEAGLQVDEEGFRRLMDQQRQRAKSDTAAKKQGHADATAFRAALDVAGPTVFTGYRELARQATLTALIGPDGLLPAAGQGEEIDVVLDQTPFYAEGGGQIADSGLIRLDGASLEVLDVQRPLPELVVHRCRVLRGEALAGAEVFAEVDAGRRAAISRSHTATHLVHRAVRGLLGESATQAGSLNAPGRLRFDFANPAAVPAGVLAEVEDEVNQRLADDLEVRWFVTSQDEARRLGAMALFGEKYGEQVRVVEVGDYARELCAGTHAQRSGQLGLVKLLGESSIGAGVRRVEALVGMDAFRFLAREHVLVSQLGGLLRVKPDELPARVGELVEQLRDAERGLERARSGALMARADQLAGSATSVGDTLLVAADLPEGTDAGDLRKLAAQVRALLPVGRAGVVALTARGSAGANVVVALTEPARLAGLTAGGLVRVAAEALGGRGGGTDDLAQGGGPNATAVADALDAINRLVGAGG